MSRYAVELSGLPVKNKVPGRCEIYNRFTKLYPNLSTAMAHVLASLAEEAERIMLGIQGWRPADKVMIVDRVDAQNNPIVVGYCCPACSYGHILALSNFCPNCGAQIEWVIRPAEKRGPKPKARASVAGR